VKIAIFNINNANRRLTNLLAWLETAQPDSVFLQDLKPEVRGAGAPEDEESRRRLRLPDINLALNPLAGRAPLLGAYNLVVTGVGSP
jgi:hypothetical protein